jgi:hypothetical protein
MARNASSGGSWPHSSDVQTGKRIALSPSQSCVESRQNCVRVRKERQGSGLPALRQVRPPSGQTDESARVARQSKEAPPICLRDAIANLLTAELDKLIGVQGKLELFETRIAKDRTLLICLRAQFYEAGLDIRGKVKAGEKLLRTISRVQQTLDQSCDQLRWPAGI